ncbi:alpha/beta hydrolase [Staphylococcus caeli]|uniref:alpha/beta hydrolase n=1 Tax=Staphylococcus caeli TaxID=2201815 RepID=UPI003F5475B6
MKRKIGKRYITLALIIAIAILTVTFASLIANDKAKLKQKNDATIPTFYLHGYVGTENSMKYLVESAIDTKSADQVVKANVSKNGMVTFDGKLNTQSKHPVIDIIFEDNTNKDLEKNAQWIENVIVATMAEYHFDKFNFVAHSMGNQSFSYYMLKYGSDSHLPQLNKQVSLAGNYNGEVSINGLDLDITLDSEGKPNQMLKEYRGLLDMKTHYPNTAQVLNIYGDLKDGTYSDGRVTNVSSRALEYLLGGNIESYETYKVTGPKAEHSELHDNPVVINKINSFLWGTEK